MMRLELMLIALALASACTSDPAAVETPPPPPPIVPPAPPPPPPPVVEVSRFEPEAAASGPRLWLEVALEAEDRAAITVWGAELGTIFGFAGHVEFSGEHLAIEAASTEGAQPLAVAREGDVAFGAVDRDRSADAPAKLAEIRARVTPDRRSSLSITRAAVRRADASFVPITTRGGTLITVGGAS